MGHGQYTLAIDMVDIFENNRFVLIYQFKLFDCSFNMSPNRELLTLKPAISVSLHVDSCNLSLHYMKGCVVYILKSENIKSIPTFRSKGNFIDFF